MPADFSFRTDRRGTRHSSVNLLLALFKVSGLKPVSFRLSTGASHLADGGVRFSGATTAATLLRPRSAVLAVIASLAK